MLKQLSKLTFMLGSCWAPLLLAHETKNITVDESRSPCREYPSVIDDYWILLHTAATGLLQHTVKDGPHTPPIIQHRGGIQLL